MGTAIKVTTERRQDSENMNTNEPNNIVTLRQKTLELSLIFMGEFGAFIYIHVQGEGAEKDTFQFYKDFLLGHCLTIGVDSRANFT